MREAALEVGGVYAGYRPTPFSRRVDILRDFSLRVEKGDFVTLLGPNGSGKSTAFYVFLGMIKPYEGKVTLLGGSPDLGLPQYQRIAYLPEEPHYHLDLTCEEALYFYGSLYDEKPTQRQVDDILERLDLTESRGKKMRLLSKGMKQKVGIGQCLFNRPDIVFMDEPTRGLDPLHAHSLRELLLELNGNGATIILNSHVLSEVEITTRSVAIMKEGRVVIHDTLERLAGGGARYQVSYRNSRPGSKAPSYLEDPSRTDGVVKGYIIRDRVYDFMSHLREEGHELCHIIEERKQLVEIFEEQVKQER